MRTGNTYGWEREILLDLDDVPVAPHFEPYGEYIDRRRTVRLKITTIHQE